MTQGDLFEEKSRHESQTFHQATLRELQNHQAPRCGAGYLYESQAQAAPGIVTGDQ
jgi:uncharacterized protein (DUF983 family)